MKSNIGKRNNLELSCSDYEEPPKTKINSSRKVRNNPTKRNPIKNLENSDSTNNESDNDFLFESEIWTANISNLIEDDLPHLDKFIEDVSEKLWAIENYKLGTKQRKLKIPYMLEIKWVKEFLSDLVKKQRALKKAKQARIKIKKINPYTYGPYSFIPRMYRYHGEVDIETGLPEGTGELIYFYPVKDTSFEKDEKVTVDKYMNCTHYKGHFKNGGPHDDNCHIKFSNNKVWYEGSMNRGWFHGQGKILIYFFLTVLFR